MLWDVVLIIMEKPQLLRFPFPTKHGDLKSKRTKFVKDWQASFNSFVVYISYIEENVF